MAKPSKKSCTSSVCRSPTRRTVTFVSTTRVRPPAEIDGGDGQRFVHRHDEIAGTIDAAPIAERRPDGFAERDADVFHRVMLIDVEIAGGRDLEIEAAMPRDEIEHVIEKADAGPILEPAAAVE